MDATPHKVQAFGQPLPSVPTIQPGRLVALDHLRGFVVVLVVLHHAVLAYCVFGHVDHRHYALSTAPVVDLQRWAGFDMLVLLNDGFFMPLMFLLSGLFVWSGLARKGAWPYLRGRLLRLGAPFVATALTVVPLAYYPSFLQAGGLPGFAAFWAATVTTGPWPSGPPWFLAVLLMFDAVATSAFVLSGRPDLPRASPKPVTPGLCFGILLAGSFLAYLPLLGTFGRLRWLSFGPFAIQASRIGLYALYFGAGAALGSKGLRGGTPSLRDALARRWPGWTVSAVLAGAVLLGAGLSWVRAGTALPGWAWLDVYAAAFVIFCAAACFALCAVFLRFGGRPGAAWDGLATNSYGVYLLHYPVVTWVQYALLGSSAGAAVKASTTFAVAVLASWGGVILLRRIPGVGRAV